MDETGVDTFPDLFPEQFLDMTQYTTSIADVWICTFPNFPSVHFVNLTNLLLHDCGYCIYDS